MIHPTAVVESGAEIGQNVRIGAFAYIEAHTQIGDGCAIGPHASVFKYATIGPGTRVHAGARIGDIPQDLSYRGAESFVRIGAHCVIREGVTIHRGTKPGSVTEVGDNCFLMAYSHVAHNVRLGPRVILANGALLAGYVEAGERAFVSGNAAVHQFVKIGKLAMVGGGAMVTKDVPPFCTLRPGGLNNVAGINVIGLRRAGYSAEERETIRQAFKRLYRSGLNVSQAYAVLRAEFPTGPASEIWAFIEKSTRGICPFGGTGDESD
ncbi:MAG: acyl-ACP--UDP-N-acetylglucosamine O-acyltransferase [Kiritimatiellia bacterium]